MPSPPAVCNYIFKNGIMIKEQIQRAVAQDHCVSAVTKSQKPDDGASLKIFCDSVK